VCEAVQVGWLLNPFEVLAMEQRPYVKDVPWEEHLAPLIRSVLLLGVLLSPGWTDVCLCREHGVILVG
jgi:hypothetical protein